MAGLGAVAAALWIGGGTVVRDGWQEAVWAAGIAVLAVAPIWSWALRDRGPKTQPRDKAVFNSSRGDIHGTMIQVGGDVHGDVRLGGSGNGPDHAETGDRSRAISATPTTTTGIWSAPVTEIEPYDVGVHRSRSGDRGRDRGAYVARDRDLELRARLQDARPHGGLVLVVGHSTAGKTRAAWNAVRTELASSRLFAPAVGADVGDLPHLVSSDTGAVVWLDDLDKHLNADTGFDTALIHELRQAKAIVVATMRTVAYDRYRQGTDTSETVDPGEQVAIEVGRQILRGVSPVRLERLWSKDELDRATDLAEQSGDEILPDAVQRQRATSEHGVAEYLAAAPELADLWHSQRDGVGTEGGHPLGYRLVAAAVDLARMGLESLSEDLLRTAVGHYSLPVAQRPEAFEQALEWATTVRYGASAMLVPVPAGCWRPFDYLVDITDSPLPAALWDTALEYSSNAHEQFAIGWSAYHSGWHDVARTAWMASLINGNVDAIVSLGLLCREQGSVEQAEYWLETAADVGHPGGIINLGVLYDEQGRDDDAEQLWCRAAQDGHIQAKHNLGVLYARQERLDEAEHWWREAAIDGSTSDMNHLGTHLAHRDPGEAEHWLRQAAQNDHVDALYNLGNLLREQQRSSEADPWLRHAVQAGSSDAMAALGDLDNDKDASEEAEHWWRQAAEAGHLSAMSNLGHLLHAHGSAQEAEYWYRIATTRGNTTAAYNLGNLCYHQERFDEAQQLWHVAANDAIPEAMANLAALFAQLGDQHEARRWFRKAAEAGDAQSQNALAALEQSEQEEF